MPKNIITLVICVIAIIISGVAVFLVRNRINQISQMPPEVFTRKEKETYLKELSIRLYIVLGFLVVSFINILLPDGLLKFIIPLLCAVVVGTLLSSIFEEVDSFDMTKDDVDIYLEEQEKRKNDMKKQRELMEEENRRRKEQKQSKDE